MRDPEVWLNIALVSACIALFFLLLSVVFRVMGV